MLVLGLGGIFLNDLSSEKVIGQTPPPSYDDEFALKNLNVMARTVNEGGDSAAVNNLVNEVFDTFKTMVASDVKTRIVDSETLYQNNQREGIEELDVVKVINGLQVYFGTPEYSKTDLYEVRKIRQSLQLFAPQFVGHGRASEANFVNNVNPTIVAKMSPTEAVFVAMTLMYQKRSNAEYQQTASERYSNWSQAHGLKSLSPVEANPERTNQVINAIGTKVNSMSVNELLSMPHKALDILGI